jgi:hypothetical protein
MSGEYFYKLEHIYLKSLRVRKKPVDMRVELFSFSRATLYL